METKMEQDSGEIRSGEAMSIFGHSIDVRRPGRSRRRATQKKFSPAAESPAKPSVERPRQRRAIAERERARAESDLSRASSMAKELERQIEQATVKARSHKSELQGTPAGGSGGSRRKNIEATGAGQAQDHQSNTLYVEVMQELDRVKRELRTLQLEVKAAREARAMEERDAEAPTPRVLSSESDSRVRDSVKQEAGGSNQGRALVHVAETGGLGKDVQATRTRAKSLQSDTEERFATASSSDVGLEPAEVAPEETLALTVTQHGEHDDDRSSLQAAEAELNSARIELESIREQGIRFSNSMERTRRETARVAEEIDRLTEQEKRASAQVQQLNARLLRARYRLDAATAADERSEAVLAELSAALRQLGEDTEAAEKERSLTELENQCVREDAEAVSAEIAAAEQRVREKVKELEAARASEAAATAKLRAVVEAAALARADVMSQRSGNVAIPRFEYDYLTGRAEVVRTVAEKKVAAAEAWVEALRAGEKEMAMRAEMIEREMGEADAADGPHAAEERQQRAGLQRAQTRRRPAPREGGGPVTSRRMGTPSSSSVVRKPSPPSFSIKSKKTRTLLSKYMKLITGKRGGQN